MITHSRWVVEPQVLVKTADGLELRVFKIEAAHIQVLRKSALVVGLGNNGNTALSSPSEQNLCGSLAVLLGNALDSLVVEKKRHVLCHAEFDKRLRTERGVGSDGNVVRLAHLDQSLLGEIWVVFDLEGGGEDASIAEDIED